MRAGRQKQTEAGKGMQASKGKQRQAGRGRQEKRWERKKRSNVRGWGSLGHACKAAKSEHPPRSADTRGDWLKNILQKQQKTSTQIGRYIRGLAQKTKWQQIATNGHPDRQIH